VSEVRLAVTDLMLDYGGQPVLSGVQFSVARGRWIAVLGANGSGKSTLLRSIGGFHLPLGGSVTIDGADLYLSKEAPLPGYASHGEDLPGFLTLRESLGIYAEAHGLGGVPPPSQQLIQRLGLTPHMDVLVRNASLGTRQKLALVIALMREPGLLLLDEAFNGLDFASALVLRSHLRERVDQQGLTILLATHALHLVSQCCDEWMLLDGGRLSKQGHVSRSSTPEAILGLELQLSQASTGGISGSC
jgi:ABC-2 type transport system ATP-binding protein